MECCFGSVRKRPMFTCWSDQFASKSVFMKKNFDAFDRAFRKDCHELDKSLLSKSLGFKNKTLLGFLSEKVASSIQRSFDSFAGITFYVIKKNFEEEPTQKKLFSIFFGNLCKKTSTIDRIVKIALWDSIGAFWGSYSLWITVNILFGLYTSSLRKGYPDCLSSVQKKVSGGKKFQKHQKVWNFPDIEQQILCF